MTSVRKIAANRSNARKSRGPRTRAGKRRSSRNALRHGLSAVSRRNPAFFDQIEQIAKAICGDDHNPSLFAQAVVIAENELMLRCISTERVAVIERFRDPYASPIGKRGADIPMAKIRIQQRDLAYNEFSQLVAKLISQGEEVFFEIYPRRCEPGEPVCKYEPLKDRDEYEALRAALPDLERLRRYERRAWSRRKRAVRELIEIRAQGAKVRPKA